ncbi:virulence protein RhuM/Fic/DOC family protein [Allomuricauda sp. M10]|uniref:virulence protein RhuM/Fic/DOC family protein n=1 Tax=Allomuricauda sp. M10 TaxID=2683292 RepID=UPI001D18A4F2|nr:virulence protein RhuM/Fic/DOC family protein [Muricauda sp. M10]
MENQIEIYQGNDGQTEISVQFNNETVWLNQEQLGNLFNRDRTVIGRHIRNIFKEGELDEDVVSANFAHTTQHGAIQGKQQQQVTKYYNLDVIISVGYRVKSIQGTKFRQWATKRLNDYLVKGFAMNEKRLAQKNEEIQILKNGISILHRAIKAKSELDDNEWLGHFSKGLELLDDYDHENLDSKGSTMVKAHYPSMENYQRLVKQMKSEFDSDVFGKEKDQNFQSSITQISKGYGKNDFYASIEEKAAMLLYFIVKNHSFVDGNKRIAAACFLKFLNENNMLYRKNGTIIISNDTLASLTLFIASSKPEEMEMVKKLTVSILNRNRT